MGKMEDQEKNLPIASLAIPQKVGLWWDKIEKQRKWV